MRVKKITLPNGVRVVYENLSHIKSISAGIYIKNGSRNESEAQNGISHFIEHMLFKGTTQNSAVSIAEFIDRNGGGFNAYTSPEYTCLYGRILPERLKETLTLFSDMILNPKLSEQDIKNEKDVVIEEIGMYQDTPEDLVFEELYRNIWPKNALGRPILGNIDTVNSFDAETISSYMKDKYTGSNIVVALSGNLGKADLESIINPLFGGVCAGRENTWSKAVYSGAGCNLSSKKIEQVHICAGFEGMGYDSPMLPAQAVLSAVFGTGSSSRLFQRIREELGLAYSVSTHTNPFIGAGVFALYCGVNPKVQKKVVSELGKEISKLISFGVSEDEVTKAKEQLKASLMLGLESTASRMSRMGRNEILRKKIPSIQETVKKLEAVNADVVNELAKQIFKKEKMCISVVGSKLMHEDAYLEIL